ncbi:MAG: filamentous hemagglutinin N-terminal domain-containing protein, partial [Veillonellales bacterium]
MFYIFPAGKFYKKLALWFLIFNLTLQPFFSAVQASEVIPDARQGKNPTVIQTSNEVTLVNILAPNDKGLSHNQYLNFQVGLNGLIFNNQTAVLKTQLAGYIAGNPNLLNSGATVILNEITGRLPTAINGYMEVAGQKADIIIANPNGIIGNNFGVINSARCVLTTGVPVIDRTGGLEKFHVQGGTVRIEGSGLNGSKTDRVDIIARAVEVNAGIWANDLHITTGANDVTYKDQILVNEPDPAYNAKGIALDVSCLGGMYANKITLIGTEKGVGINSQGSISAGSGNLTLTQEGKIILAGKTLSSGGIELNSKNAFTQSGVIYTTDNMNIKAVSINNSGTIAAANDVTINAQDVTSTGTLGAGIQSGGQLGSAGTLNITAQNSLAANGKNLAAGDMTMKAGNVDLQGASTFIGNQGNIAATAGDINNTKGILQSQKAISLAARDLKNQGGKINTNDNLTINLSGALQNEQGLLYTGQNLTANTIGVENSGTIAAAKDVNINAQDVASTGTLGAGIQGDGQLGSAGNLTITAQNSLAAHGKNLAAGDMTMRAGNVDLQGASTFIGNQGNIAATAGDINNT